jgi:hypothetical protein
MNFLKLLASVEATIPELSRRAARDFATAREEDAALAGFASAADLLGALRGGRLSQEERAAVVLAMVQAHRRGTSRLWQTLLVTAFSRMLRSFRSRLRLPAGMRRAGAEDLDQVVIAGFVGALGAGSISAFCPILSLKRATAKGIAREMAELRGARTGKHEELDEKHGVEIFGGEHAEKERATGEVVRMLPSLGLDAEIAASLAATLAEGEPLRAYVERVFGERSGAERSAIYGRLRSARRVAIAQLRQRLSRRAVAA